MKWGEVETGIFVKIYVKYENLWNPSSLHYKLREERLKSYKQIISQFKDATGISLSLNELTTKIKTLRCTYILELGKIIERARNGSIYKPRIKWFNDLHECLKDVAKPRNMDPAIISSMMYDDVVQKEWDPEKKSEFKGQKMWVPNRLDNDADNESDNFISQNTHACFSSIRHDKMRIECADNSFIRRPRIKNRSSSINHSSVVASTEQSNSDLRTSEDEFDIYGKYIASQLRSLDLQDALKIKLQIQILVNRARISELRQDQ